jgi:hypothetical protein
MRARGVPMQSRRVELGEIAAFRSAFFTNSSCLARPIVAIDAIALALNAELLSMLDACMEVAPWQRI